MELLDFQMPPFARIQWVSKTIKEKYEPKFNLAKNVFKRLEIETVAHGIRSCTTGHVFPEKYDEFTQNLAKKGLIFLPIQKVGYYVGSSSYHPKVEPGKPWLYYGVITNNLEDGKVFVEASKNKDHIIIGKLLGYPDCCIKFFNDLFAKGYTDLQWHSSLNTNGHIKSNIQKERYNQVRLKNVPWEINTMLRSFNLHLIYHQTCSHDCQHSLKIARKWLKLAEDLKVEGLEELKMFLQMPMEWDSLKGIAYIRTPLFKAMVNSNPSIEQYVVQREGIYYPEDAPKAIKFPWNEYYKLNKKGAE